MSSAETSTTSTAIRGSHRSSAARTAPATSPPVAASTGAKIRA